MTAIKVYRAPGATKDRWGDPQTPPPSTWPVWATYFGDASWATGDESTEPTRRTITTRREVYIELSRPSGILTTDEVEVDGIRYRIDGTVAEWEEDGEHAGTHFRIEVAA
ncbi:hypothetical protein [Homoserinibacter sp. GY 40078]|uniref:hypothetical protein n=1 Tax=Homoserinibacter sp. GY 40078 TaxID=2603275 RepID=UPI0011C6FEC8|nr:hypothetical protein [Homoserinibacter sp. GY 40078]TXK17403.1 hypothetical protein FVQ89_11250 [Homoserinibacter sp. GY 40078]